MKSPFRNPLIPHLMAAGLIIASSHAATYQWVGTTDSTWTTSTNWGTGSGITAGPAPAGITGGHRLNVNNGNANKVVYSATQGTTVYNGSTTRGLVIGSGALGSGTMEITGGTFSTLGSGAGDVISNQDNATGRLIINGGTFISTNVGIGVGIGAGNNRTGILDILSGTATVAALTMNTNNATVNLDGGTLEANSITRPGGTGTLNLNGGTLKARQNNATFISGVSSVNVKSGGAIIDTNGFDVTVTNPLLDAGGGGGLTKQGAGKLTLAGANTYTGNTTINAGTLALASTSAINYSSPTSGAGALEIGGTSVVNLTGNSTHSGGTTVLSGANLGGEGSLAGSLGFNGTTTFFFDPTTTGPTGHFRAGSINASAATITFAPSSSSPATTGIVVMEATSGTISGTVGVNFLSNSRVALSLNGTNTQLIADYTPGALVWKGEDGTNPSFWDTETTVNWQNTGSSAPDKFFASDSVVFNDDNSNSSFITIDVQGTVFPGSVTFGASSKDYALAGGGIGGTGALSVTGDGWVTISSLLSTTGNVSKAGTGTLTLSGANTYTGTTSVTDGILVTANASALGSATGGTSVSGTGALNVNGMNLGTEVITIAGDGQGDGAVINTAAIQINALGRLVLAADASIGGSSRWDVRNSTPTVDMGGFKLTKKGTNYCAFVGTTMSNPGSLDVESGTFGLHTSAGLPGSEANTATVRAGAFLNNYATTGPLAWKMILEDTATYWAENGNATQNNWTGPVEIASSGTGIFRVDAGQFATIAGVVSGTGSALSKIGSGTLILTNANTYSGGSSVSNGTLRLNSATTPGITGNLNITGDVTSNTRGIVQIYQPDQLQAAANVTMNVTGSGLGYADLALCGSSQTIASLNTTADATVTGFTFVENRIFNDLGAGNGTLTIDGASASNMGPRTLIRNGANPEPNNGTLSIVKKGAGTLTFQGTTSHSGATSVDGGEFVLAGSIGSQTTVTVGGANAANAPTLSGTGTCAAPLTISAANGGTAGKVSPGGSGTIGTLTASGGVALAGSYACDVDATTSDALAITGNLDLSGATLTINSLATPTATSYTLATFTGTLTGTFGSPTLPSGYALSYTATEVKLVKSGYDSWIGTFSGLGDTTTGGDPDNDGMQNLLEYVLNGNPGASDPSILPDLDASGTNFVFTFTRRLDSKTDSQQFFQYNTDLGAVWTEIAIPTATSGSVIITPVDAVTEQVQVTISKGTNTRIFGRLKATK